METKEIWTKGNKASIFLSFYLIFVVRAILIFFLLDVEHEVS
jgi:hypothetical protein